MSAHSRVTTLIAHGLEVEADGRMPQAERAAVMALTEALRTLGIQRVMTLVRDASDMASQNAPNLADEEREALACIESDAGKLSRMLMLFDMG